MAIVCNIFMTVTFQGVTEILLCELRVVEEELLLQLFYVAALLARGQVALDEVLLFVSMA